MSTELALQFDDYITACKHFNISLGLFDQATIQSEIKAYQLLGKFLEDNNLGCHYKLDGTFEISSLGKSNV